MRLFLAFFAHQNQFRSFDFREEPLMKKRHCSHKFSVTSNATQLTDISLSDHHPDTIMVEDQSKPVFGRSVSASSRSIKGRQMQTVEEDPEQVSSEVLRRDEHADLIRKDVRNWPHLSLGRN